MRDRRLHSIRKDAPLRGDAYLALGELAPLLEAARPNPQWHMLWQAYQAHALCLAGRMSEAVELCSRLVPGDVYEWTHVFECLFRADRLDAIDLNSFLYRPPHEGAARWKELARQRMRADYLRVTEPRKEDLETIYRSLIEAYDQGGLPFERVLTRLGFSRYLQNQQRKAEALEWTKVTVVLARRQQLPILLVDALHLWAELAEADTCEDARREAEALRRELGYHGPRRP